MIRSCIVLFGCLLAPSAVGQTVQPDLPGRPPAPSADARPGPGARDSVHVRVRTRSADAVALVGTTALDVGRWHRVEIDPTVRTVVRLVPSGQPFDGPSASVELPPGDSVEVDIDLPVRTRVESLPLRARLSLVATDGTEQLLGTAPLDVDRPRGERATLVARLDDYAETRATLDGQATLTLVLPPGPGVLPPEATVLPTDTRSRARRRLAADVSLIGLAVGAAAFAVDAKFRADRLDDRYRDPTGPDFGDEALRERTVRLDTRSLVGLAAMQASLGVFALRLVLR